MMLFNKLHFSKSLTALFCSINFMFLCSYCATHGKIQGGLGHVGCMSDGDCVLNAYCMNNSYCMCSKESVEDKASQMCRPIAKKMNDKCEIDVQCTSMFGTLATCYKNSLSEGGICRCRRNSHFQDGLCYASARLGDPCKVSDNCVSVSNVPTYCAQSKCVCAANYHPSDDRLDCLQNTGLGERCNKDEDCITKNSYCYGVCRCLNGYVINMDNTDCLPATKQLREECLENSQCQKYLSNAFCDSQEKICKCVNSSHELDKSCWISAELGEACTHPNQCIIPSMNRSTVACSHGACSCVNGYTRVQSDCVKDALADSSTLEKCLFLIVAAVLLSLPND